MFGLFTKIKSITTTELAAHLRNNQIKEEIIDVRESYEYKKGHIRRARNIPLNQVSTAQLDTNKKYFVICQSGMRSKKACKVLSKMNYDVINISGGMMAWQGKVTRKD
ncbi:rhodanese-like domain-containing protein [Lactococcus formosensis]|uniref:Rhodanese-like domain-containing protein n=1 Tax=Lactococcus formosensis TaxID=1281486 RepID=A0A9X4P008_9LACT|nr:rhodanese-like domain-containing protein [Lactococcus formosensis]MCO7180935.1 rhodanese-like domain-containing protein [Lactococcus formosensis]MDG6111964.1 rhodanese-like domain-containing protein [Lactococcus formosensis]MDG6118133.1 rhodanese-like domain-containing protein [Lactococcus formosensis]MDG6133122.1 rhodanese-like domain-containing protein [Lactococcus formosensis]MDG6134993.1 rhodanese-like domain-containing protein [Lactococcus formosensis]